MNRIENTNTLINNFILCCRTISQTYKKKIQSDPNLMMAMSLADCEATESRIVNYASLLNKRLHQDYENKSIDEHNMWKSVLEPRITDIVMKKFSVFRDLQNPVLIKRSPPASKFVYEINISSVYIMCNDVNIASDPNNAISDSRRKFLSALVGLTFNLFEEYRTQLRGVKEEYSPNNNGIKMMEDTFGKLPDIVKAVAPDANINTEILTTAVRGMIPQQGDTEETAQSRIQNIMDPENLTNLMGKITGKK